MILYVSPLTTSSTPTASPRYLELAFTAGSGIRKQDAASAFGSVAANPIGAPLAWRYLRNHWTRLVQ